MNFFQIICGVFFILCAIDIAYMIGSMLTTRVLFPLYITVPLTFLTLITLTIIKNDTDDVNRLNAELVTIQSKSQLPTTNQYYKVMVESKMYIYRLIEVK